MLATLAAQRLPLQILVELVLHIVGEGADVAIGGSRRDYKHVGDYQELGDVEQRDIQALLVIDRSGRCQSGFDGFRCRANDPNPSVEDGQS